jgi:hypothetical protein
LARPPYGAGTDAGGFERNHPLRFAQFDAQLMMVAHDRDVPSRAGPPRQAGRDRLDQIHDRFANDPIVFTQVSHVDRPRFVPRPSVEFWLRRTWRVTAPIDFDPLLSSFLATSRPPSGRFPSKAGLSLVSCRSPLFGEALAAEGALGCSLKRASSALRGVVSKRAGSLYRSGRSRNWLKIKNPDFVRTCPEATRAEVYQL